MYLEGASIMGWGPDFQRKNTRCSIGKRPKRLNRMLKLAILWRARGPECWALEKIGLCELENSRKRALLLGRVLERGLKARGLNS